MLNRKYHYEKMRIFASNHSDTVIVRPRSCYPSKECRERVLYMSFP